MPNLNLLDFGDEWPVRVEDLRGPDGIRDYSTVSGAKQEDDPIAALNRKRRIEEVQLLLDQTEFPLCGRCIELGAGYGYFSAMLSKKSCVVEAVAVDIQSESVRRWGPTIWQHIQPNMRKLRYVFADMNRLDGRVDYDAVIFCASLHHSDDIPLSLRVAHGLLKPGGVVVLHGEHYHARFFPWKKSSGGVTPHTIPEFSGLLKRAGFNPHIFRYALLGGRFPRLRKLLFTVWPFKYVNGWFRFSSFVMMGVKAPALPE